MPTNSPSAPTPTPTPISEANCAEQSATSNLPLVTTCLSARAKMKIHDEYAAHIADGTIFQLNGGFDPRYYPGEVLASVMAIAEDTGDQVMMNWAVGQLNQLRLSLQAHNGFLIWPIEYNDQPTFGELAQSRVVLSLALIYHATGNDTAKQAALLAFRGLELLPLVTVTSSLTGKSYQLPPYAYHNETSPIAIPGRSLDPNHDAALAAVYTVMAKLVLDDQEAVTQALSKADGYFAAASDLAGPERCLPLADDPAFRDACDTRYNGFWSFLLEIVSRYRPSRDAGATIDQQFPFHRSALLAFQTHRFYPDVVSGPYPDPVEPLLWLPSAARNLATNDFLAFVTRTNDLIENGNPADWPRGNLYPKYYE